MERPKKGVAGANLTRMNKIECMDFNRGIQLTSSKQIKLWKEV